MAFARTPSSSQSHWSSLCRREHLTQTYPSDRRATSAWTKFPKITRTFATVGISEILSRGQKHKVQSAPTCLCLTRQMFCARRERLRWSGCWSSWSTRPFPALTSPQRSALWPLSPARGQCSCRRWCRLMRHYMVSASSPDNWYGGKRNKRVSFIVHTVRQ